MKTTLSKKQIVAKNMVNSKRYRLGQLVYVYHSIEDDYCDGEFVSLAQVVAKGRGVLVTKACYDNRLKTITEKQCEHGWFKIFKTLDEVYKFLADMAWTGYKYSLEYAYGYRYYPEFNYHDENKPCVKLTSEWVIKKRRG